jgi:hypothetical protein
MSVPLALLGLLGQEPSHALLADYGLSHLEADLRWIDRIRS